MQGKDIKILVDYFPVELNTSSILYADLDGRKTVIHVISGETYKTYTYSIDKLEEVFGDDAYRISRTCLVAKNAVRAMEDDNVELINGETLHCSRRRKGAPSKFVKSGRKELFFNFDKSHAPTTTEEYNEYYRVFDNLQIAFTDIEMVFDEENRAIDWRFRYVNSEMERIEKRTREEMLDKSFKTLFPNMDEKWLCAYERCALYGEKLEIMDYSPEIDTYLRIICFPTFEGHCGCLLFDLQKITPIKTSNFEQIAIDKYLQILNSTN